MYYKFFKQSAIVIIICVVSVLFVAYFVFKPAPFDVFDFSIREKTNISSVINNLFTPVLSLVSVILLYITLNKQNESISDQRMSKNLDLVLSMVSNLENEYRSFSYLRKGTRYEGGEKKPYSEQFYGYDAMVEILPRIKTKPQKFGFHYFSDKLLSLIDSYKVLNESFRKLNIDPEIKQSLSNKLDSFYTLKLRYVFLQIAFYIKDCDDKHSMTFLGFVYEQEKIIDKRFDLRKYNNVGELMAEILQERSIHPVD